MTDLIAPRGFAATYEGAQECVLCSGDGHSDCPGCPCGGMTCAHCDGTGIEPAADASPVTSEDVERALRRAEEG